ncbi:hypothetical protein [Streptomyces sp. LN699]|uniref:hypothetical protein n=1 Tax=Streptomyces sp. LN699 TaxID=3112981 RepID=UPI00371FFBFF
MTTRNTPKAKPATTRWNRFRTAGVAVIAAVRHPLAGNLVLGPAPAVTRHRADPARWRTHPHGESALCVKLP